MWTDCSAPLPNESSVLFLVPYLPTVHEVLPQDVGSRGYGCQGIEEGDGEPDTNHCVFLS